MTNVRKDRYGIYRFKTTVVDFLGNTSCVVEKPRGGFDTYPQKTWEGMEEATADEWQTIADVTAKKAKREDEIQQYGEKIAIERCKGQETEISDYEYVVRATKTAFVTETGCGSTTKYDRKTGERKKTRRTCSSFYDPTYRIQPNTLERLEALTEGKETFYFLTFNKKRSK